MLKMSVITDLFSHLKRPGRLVRHLGLSFLEAVVTKGLNFFIILMLVRALGPADYGKYSFIFVAVTLLSAFFDFGMENTTVRFAARDNAWKSAIFGLYLSLKLGILILLLLALGLGQAIFLKVLRQQELAPFMPFMLIGLLGESLFFVNDTYCQANHWFQWRLVLNSLRYGLSFLMVAGLFVQQKLQLHWAMYAYCIPLLLSLLFVCSYGRFLVAFWQGQLPSHTFKEMLSYQRWMFVYSMANNLLSRLDFFLLGLWVSYAQLGIYNAAVQLCAIIAILPLVLGKVLLPTLSDLAEPQIFRLSEKLIQYTALLVLSTLLLIPVSTIGVPWLLGKSYQASVGVFQILVLAYAAALMSMPFEQVLYSLGKPEVLCQARYSQLALIFLLNLFLIPLFGVYGAAGVTVLGRIFFLAQVRMQYAKYQHRSLTETSPQWVVGV